MTANTVTALSNAGQSVWLDYIRRSMTRSGELAKRIESEGLRGVTSNPAIFRSSMGGGEEYADALSALATDHDRTTKDVYEALAIEDIQEACDAMRPVYEATEHVDGFVSLEVSPRLSRDTAGTLATGAAALKERGAKRVFAYASHAVFSGPAIERIENSPLDRVIISNSIPLTEEGMACSKIETVSIAPLIAEAIRRIHHGDSVSSLFV